jgi:NAD(P)H-dependent FMN reductase
MPTLMIVIASMRPGRVGLPVGRWFEGRAQAHGGFEVQVVDLAELRLPFMDEPNHPRLRQYTQQHTKRWSAMVDSADAFALVTPEYNHGYSPALKNALDYLNQEWRHKPVGFVSYGGVSAGTRAAVMLEPVLIALQMTALAQAVHIPFVARFIDDEGDVEANEVMEKSADALLDELARVNDALRPLREASSSR